MSTRLNYMYTFFFFLKINKHTPIYSMDITPCQRLFQKFYQWTEDNGKL